MSDDVNALKTRERWLADPARASAPVRAPRRGILPHKVAREARGRDDAAGGRRYSATSGALRRRAVDALAESARMIFAAVSSGT